MGRHPSCKVPWPDLPWGVREETRQLGSEGHQEAGRKGCPRQGQRGRELQGARAASRSEASTENWRGGRYCAQSGHQVKPLEASDGTYMGRLCSKNTETSLKDVIREEHNHIYCFKTQSRRAFPSPLPPPPPPWTTFQPPPGAWSLRTAVVCFPVWSNWNAYLSSARKREQGIAHSSNIQEATLALIF